MSMHRYDNAGFSGESYDRNVFEANLSTVNKLQRDFWTAKQVLRKKLGKSDDQCIVSSDSELDAKLDLFRTVQTTCADLIKAVENYQNCICVLSRDENCMGRFLKDMGAQDKTQAGKMMAAVGKSQCYTAQQRLALRNPLGRLHHDIETFRYRAVGDSVLSVDQMEAARTNYRASLRWMQDISSNLDPEQYKKLEKFRRVQNEVRLNKDKFDKLKWAVCQKVDLLCASRSNLFSNVLVPYQNELIKFWEKTARTMAAVLENIKDYQHYEFKLLKGLNPIQDLDQCKKSDDEKQSASENENNTEENTDQLISLSDQEIGDNGGDKIEGPMNSLNIHNGNGDKDSLLNFYDEENCPNGLSDMHGDVYHDIRMLDECNTVDEPLIGVGENQTEAKQEDNDNLLLGNLETTDFEQPSKEDLDFLNDILGEEEKTESGGDLESQWLSVFGDFTQAPVPQPAGEVPQKVPDSSGLMQAPNSNPPQTSGYLPSQLMDMMTTGAPMTANHPPQMGQMPLNMPQMQQQQKMVPSGYPQQQMAPPMMGQMQPPSYQSMFGNTPMMGNYQQQQQQGQPNMGQGAAPKPQAKKDQKGNMSAWFNLFAELDPLQNPDALGQKKDETNDKQKPEGGAC
uniref:Islet cell autoantigen 1-like n=1 Tax=Phallusia mammillata TaxID=59560 RepID=A0A6F9DFU1_9ASCI|nr:islet cell autoantigen 1-like [Phallusia mammillata]